MSNLWAPTAEEDERYYKQFKFSKTSAHPLGGDNKTNSHNKGGGGGEDLGVEATSEILGIDLTVPLPTQGRNVGSLDRAERRRQVLNAYQVEDSGPVLSNLLEQCGEALSETQQLQMKLQRIAIETEGSVEGRRAGSGQTELILQTERLDGEIKGAWESGEKVRSLRVAIQSCKLLGMQVIPDCYPSNFVLVAQVLDTFGDFVADRLQATAAGKSFVVAALLRRGQAGALADVIPAEATEVANNWFLKISSIRELLPRIYIELSLLKCYMYVAKKQRTKMKDVVTRLGSQIRGVADPVVAAHTRWYLFLRAAEVLKGDGWAVCLIQCCLDTIITMNNNYRQVHLMVPALQWQLDTLAKFGGKEKRLVKLVGALFDHARVEDKPLETQLSICQGIARAFDVKLILPYTKDLLAMMEEILATKVESPSTAAAAGGSGDRSDSREGSQQNLHRGSVSILDAPDTLYVQMVETMSYVFAEASDLSNVLTRKERLGLLKKWWSYLAQSNHLSTAAFISAIGAMMQFVARHIGEKQLNTFLGELRNLLLGTANVTPEIQNNAFMALNGILMSNDVAFLLNRSHFLPCVQWLPGELKRRIAVYVLEKTPTSSSLMTQVLELCRMIHDGLADAVLGSSSHGTIASEMAGKAISRAIQQCWTDEPEVYLSFLCECRHSLPRLDSVKSTLIHEALKMVNKCGTKMSGMNNLAAKNKVRNAAKACLAFCHVTAPAISDIFGRIKHLVLAATVGFQHGFVAQGESLTQLCVRTLGDVVTYESFRGVNRDNDVETVATCNQLLALAAITPPHNKYGPLYIVDAILAWVKTHKFGDRSSAKLQILQGTFAAVVRAHRGGPAWALSSFLNKGDSFEASRQTKVELVLDALNEELDVAALNKGDLMKQPKDVGMVCLDILDLFVYTTNLKDVAQDLASPVRAVVHKANNVALTCGDGTIEYVRRMQAVVNNAKGTLEESWQSLTTGEVTYTIAEVEKGVADQQEEEGETKQRKKKKKSDDEVPAEEEDVDALLAAAEDGQGDEQPTAGGDETHVDPTEDVDTSML